MMPSIIGFSTSIETEFTAILDPNFLVRLLIFSMIPRIQIRVYLNIVVLL